jgi:outer membrane usher protein FimD/PapC
VLRPVACAVGIALIIGAPALAEDNLSQGGAPAFDVEILKNRGIDPKLAELLSQSSRFLPGREKVTLFVNGDRVGQLYATFDAQGKLCFNTSLLKTAGLVVPTETVEPQEQVAEMEEKTVTSSDASSNDSTDEKESSDSSAYSTVLSHAAGPVSFWAVPQGELNNNEEASDAGGECYDFIAAWPQTEVDLRPGKQEVHLVVPQEALQAGGKDISRYHTGGTAALLNYDALTMQNHASSSRSQFSSLSTEAGLNIGDWALRSRHNMIEQNGERTRQHLYTYAQHTVLPLQSIVQLGQIDINSPLFAGAPITGVQLLPDTALLPGNNGGVVIEGLAQTSQARVEVKQNGLLIHSTVVPAGPFTLQDIPLLRVNTNVDVTVYESDGTQHTSSVPAASLRRVNFSVRGWSLAAGKVRQTGEGSTKEPGVMAVSNDWLMGNYSLLTSGLMLSEDYRSTGVVIDSVFGQETTLSIGTVFSQATEEDKKGMQNSLAVSTRISEKITANASATRQSQGYRDLMDTLENRSSEPFNPADPDAFWREKDIDNSDTQLSAGVNWSVPRFGGGGINFVQSKASDGEWGRTLSLSWALSFYRATFSTTYQKELKGDNGDSLFLSLSVPLGENRRLQTRASRSNGNDMRLSTTYNESLGESLNYSLSASRQGADNGTDLSGNLSATPRYAQLNLGYAENGNDSRNYNAGLRGALVLHREGITPSPNQIQDTFGIVSVGDEAGVQIRTPGGAVWTDAGGRAVVAQFSSWKENQIEVVTNTLSRNTDIDNGYKKVEVGRGSVSRIDFNIVKVRRVLLDARFADGTPIPKGASVLDKENNYLTTVVDDGHIFLQDAGEQVLRVNLPGGDSCRLSFQLPEKPETESYFENASAVCNKM